MIAKCVKCRAVAVEIEPLAGGWKQWERCGNCGFEVLGLAPIEKPKVVGIGGGLKLAGLLKIGGLRN